MAVDDLEGGGRGGVLSVAYSGGLVAAVKVMTPGKCSGSGSPPVMSSRPVVASSWSVSQPV